MRQRQRDRKDAGRDIPTTTLNAFSPFFDDSEESNLVSEVLAATLPPEDLTTAVASVDWSSAADTRPSVRLDIAGHPVKALVDTGANLSVLGEETFVEIFGSDWKASGSKGRSLASRATISKCWTMWSWTLKC